MLGTLHEAIDQIDLPLSGAELATLLAERDRLDALVVAGARALDDDCAWQDDGAVSLHGWLRDMGGRGRKDAGRIKNLAQRTRAMPGVAEAWQNGILSSGHVEAIVANVSSRTGALFAEQEAELLPTLSQLSVIECETAMRVWKAHADAIVEGPEPPEPERSFNLSPTLNDRFVGDLSLGKDDGELLQTALDVAETKDADGEPRRTPAERRADALVDICKEFLDHHTRPTTPRNRPHVTVIVNLQDAENSGPGRYLDGLPTDPVELSAMLCDSRLRRLIMNGGSQVLDLGQPTKVIPDALRDAVIARDQHCRFGQCDRPPRWCDVHHVVWLTDGGHTAITNLVLCCRRHHRLLHRPAWDAKLLPDGTLEITNPDGLTRTSRPPGATPKLL